MKLPIKLPQAMTRFAGKLWLKTKNASPEIFVGTGIICGIGAVVMTGVQTWKNRERLESDGDAIRPYTTQFVDVEEERFETMSDSEKKKVVVCPSDGKKSFPVKIPYNTLTDAQKKALWQQRKNLAVDIVKIYWIPVVLGVSSVGLIWGGRTMFRKQISALTAAYAALSDSYNRYRQRVIEELGAEKDQEFQYGYKMVETVDPETGKTDKKPIIDKTANLSEYAFWFDGGDFDKNTGTWTWKNNVWQDRNKLGNRWTVKRIQEQAEYELNTIGYCSLEKIALEFGIDPERAKKWHDYGWVYQEGRRNVVEFGVLEGEHQLEVNKAFTDDSYSQDICLINPNVDGYIGYVYENYKKYDRRYGKGEQKNESIRLKINSLIQRRHAEEMEMLIDAARR